MSHVVYLGNGSRVLNLTFYLLILLYSGTIWKIPADSYFSGPWGQKPANVSRTTAVVNMFRTTAFFLACDDQYVCYCSFAHMFTRAMTMFSEHVHMWIGLWVYVNKFTRCDNVCEHAPKHFIHQTCLRTRTAAEYCSENMLYGYVNSVGYFFLHRLQVAVQCAINTLHVLRTRVGEKKKNAWSGAGILEK